MICPLLLPLFGGASVASLAAWIGNERTEHFGMDEDAEDDLVRPPPGPVVGYPNRYP